MMSAGGALSGTKITLVVDIDPVGNRLKAVRVPVIFEDREQFIFTMKATHRIIADVGGALPFVGLHNVDRDFALASKRKRIFQMSACQAWGIGNHGAHFAA